ncbi:MAG: DUF3298 domain-containing protein [Bacteroidales bacterium]
MRHMFLKFAFIAVPWLLVIHGAHAQTAYYHYEAKNQSLAYYFDLITLDTVGFLSLNSDRPMWLSGNLNKSSGEWIFRTNDEKKLMLCFNLNNKQLENIRFCETGVGDRSLPQLFLTWNKGNVPFKVLRLTKKQALIPEIRNSPFASFDVVFPDPQWPANPRIADSIRKALLKIYLGEDEIKSIAAQPALAQRLNQMAHQYQEENRDIYDPEDSSPLLNREFSIRPFIACNTGYVLSVIVDLYAYNGGAHGLEVKRFVNLNLKNGETFQLSHLFDTSNRYIAAKLKELIKTHIKEQYQITSQQSLTEAGFFTDDIELPVEFYLTPSGIGFYYNVYEIAPFSMGPIQVFIPNNEVKTLMGENIWSLPENFWSN